MAWQRAGMAIVIEGKEDLLARAGSELGAGEWSTMDMNRIRGFAEATGDRQWIHVDEERAAKESPFGKAIAHGYLTLSITAGQFFEVLDLRGFEMVVNYGANKIRFPAPLKLGDRFRVSFQLGVVKDVGGGWTEGIFNVSVEVENQTKPACVAETVFRFKSPS